MADEDLIHAPAASDLPQSGQQSSVPVQSKNVSGHYDINLSGWLRVGGKYYWFEIDTMDESGRADIDDIEGTPRYLIYDIEDRHAKAKALQRTRRFRHMVGWHWCQMPKNDWKRSYFSQAQKPDWKSFYGDETDKIDNWGETKKLVGVSIDYNKTVCFVASPQRQGDRPADPPEQRSRETNISLKSNPKGEA